MTSTQYENIILENALKKKALSHARAVFSPRVRPGTVFDVVASTIDLVNEGQTYKGYATHLMAFDELSRSKSWQILLSVDKKSSEKEGLEELVRDLQAKFSDMISKSYCDI